VLFVACFNSQTVFFDSFFRRGDYQIWQSVACEGAFQQLKEILGRFYRIELTEDPKMRKCCDTIFQLGTTLGFLEGCFCGPNQICG